jgi:MFS family permease
MRALYSIEFFPSSLKAVLNKKHDGDTFMPTIFYGWWIVLACFSIAAYVGGACFFGFTAFFEPIVEEFGWSYTQVSIAFSLRGLEMGILAPLTGFLVDRFGARKLVFGGTFIVGLALILLSLINSLLMFYSASILIAFGASGCSSTVLMTAVAQWFRRNVGKAIGLVACGFGAGGILIPAVVWLIDLYGWRIALIILGLGMWVLGIPLSFVILHKPEHYGYLPDGEVSVDGSDSHRGPEGKEEGSFKEALKSGNFWKIGIAEVIRMMITIAVIIHIMPYLSSIGMSTASAAFVATSIPILSIIGRLGFGWLSDIFDTKYVLAIVHFLFGMGILAFAYIHVKWLMFPFLLVFSPAFGGAVSLRGAIIQEYFGRAFFGRMLGITLGMTAIGGVIGPSVAGWTFDHLGRYQPIWLFFAGVTVIAMVSILRLGVPQQIGKE